MTHACICKSTDRSLVILYGGVEHDLGELIDFSDRDWLHYPDFSAFIVSIGKAKKFKTVTELADFLNGIFPSAYQSLRVTWLDPEKSIHEQVPTLLEAKPISKFAPRVNSPLVNILENRRIETWFQPVFSYPSMRIWGYECLMRGRTKDGEIVGAGDMLAWAKQENLLFLLDRVCRESHIKNAAHSNVPLNCNFLINFLPSVIYDPKVCLTTTIAAAERHGLYPQRVIFEVVETEVIEDHARLRYILDHYRDYGFRVALDDLGTGHSGLELLGDLSPDLIKIDRALIAKSVNSPIHHTICQSIVDIAKKEGRLVLAEGVETHEEWALLEPMGIDLYQGYLFGRPQKLPVQEPLVNTIDRSRCSSSDRNCSNLAEE